MRTKSILDFLKKHNLDKNNAQNHIARLIGGAQHEKEPRLNFNPSQHLSDVSVSNLSRNEQYSQQERIDENALSKSASFKGSSFGPIKQ